MKFFQITTGFNDDVFLLVGLIRTIENGVLRRLDCAKNFYNNSNGEIVAEAEVIIRLFAISGNIWRITKHEAMFGGKI